MKNKKDYLFIAGLVLLLIISGVLNVSAKDKILFGEKVPGLVDATGNKVSHPCLTPHPESKIKLPLERENRWSLPKAALADDFLDTIKILVLRYNFQYEEVDDPNTTGRGVMNLGSHDSATVVNQVGHYIDPPPHNKNYFDAHMQALKNYYEVVSEGKLTFDWEIWPTNEDSAYTLPHPMSYYGKCEFSDVIEGLENYFRDCIRTADSVSPAINFGKFNSFFLFHAGSDRQNDIGFPETCNDLFTGFINYFDPDTVYVDSGATIVRTALLMPETASQDNRATAMNAVIAHEFGHQLGLIDLYSSSTFMSQLGDFALMDNNGFGTGIDFGFDVGRVFGALPIFPMAWSRAYLGFVDVVDFRQGADIEIVAAEMVSDGIKVARVPITDKEYYLLENRLVEVDGFNTGARVDSITNVILGPAYSHPINGITPSPEYDFLMPGSGVLIYHVDERVAGLDYNFDGDNNFDDNQLQWVWDSNGQPVDRFIHLMEADGFVNFGGFYRLGYGSEEDMYRDDRNDALTPNTNPPSIDNSGNNSRINITNIHRKWDSTGIVPIRMDSIIRFDVETDKLVADFPLRAGYPEYRISPIAADLNNDGLDEIIVTSGNLISVITGDGKNFLNQIDPCACPEYMDSTYASIHPGRTYPVPLFAELPGLAITKPVVGTFPDYTGSNKLVAIGSVASGGAVYIFRLDDSNDDGQAERERSLSVQGIPLALSFKQSGGLYILTDRGFVTYLSTLLGNDYEARVTGSSSLFHGMCQVSYDVVVLEGDSVEINGVVVLAGDSTTSKLVFVRQNADTLIVIDSIPLDDYYSLGPIAVDLDDDGMDEIIVGSPSGELAVVSLNPFFETNNFDIIAQNSTGFDLHGNPIAGDVDLDGQPDIIIGGRNAIYAFNRELYLKQNYPKELSDRYLNDIPASTPIMADLEKGDLTEIALSTELGNVYAYGEKIAAGFPLSGGEMGIGSPIFVNDTSGGKFGYLGLDGWFYLWHVDPDSVHNFWPMAGADEFGSFNFDESKLPQLTVWANPFPEDRFYNYPNPTTTGSTTIRYFLGEEAERVELEIFDFNGENIASFNGQTDGNTDNELIWDCSSVTPGIYRCIIRVTINGNEETAFTDIAVIR